MFVSDNVVKCFRPCAAGFILSLSNLSESVCSGHGSCSHAASTLWAVKLIK